MAARRLTAGNLRAEMSSSSRSPSAPSGCAENIDVFDFELTGDEMARIAALDTKATLFFDHDDPEWVDRLNSVRVD